MKTYIKTIAVSVFVSVFLMPWASSMDFPRNRGNGSLQASSTGSVYGSGKTREQAYANAVRRVPGGAIQVGCTFNGWSSSRSDGSEYSGNFTCRITWKKF